MSFYFAWCGTNQAFNASLLREDEILFDFDIGQLEGQIPTLSIDIKNPHIGLLAPGRSQWAWFSYQSPFDNSVTPLFYGQLVALPSNILAEVVTLQFLARPPDFLAQKQAVANALMVSPYYDRIWISQDKWTDPDTVLEPYSCAWHIDRTSLKITVSDIIFGEDGTEEFKPEDSFYDSVTLSFAQAPQTQVIFTGTVNWTQAGAGLVNLPPIYGSFYNGDQWLSDWPKPGASLQGGWSVAGSDIVDIGGTANAKTFSVSTSWKNEEKTHEDGDTMSTSTSNTVGVPGYFVRGETQTGLNESFTVGDPDTGTAAAASNSASWVTLMEFDIAASLSLQWDMSNGRTEALSFTMNSGLQSFATIPADAPANPILLSMSGADVGLNLGGEVPIGNAARSFFFSTDRGIQALQYPLLVARAHLLQQARAVKVVFDCTFERAMNLSCRKNALLHDSRLPGGQAFGKITEYHIKGTGDSGLLSGTVQIECTVGAGGAVTVNTGTPTYVEEGYVVDYQVYSGSTVSLPTSDLAFSLPVDNGSGPLTGRDAVLKYEVHLGAAAPALFVPISNPYGLPGMPTEQDNQQFAQQYYSDWVTNNPTWLEMILAPVSGNAYSFGYPINVGTLVVPKMIDLAAPNA